MTPLDHISSVVAIWTMMLFGLRFAAGAWLIPLVFAGWHLVRCREPGKHVCRARFRAIVDRLHVDLISAITTPWSGTLLFAGSVAIGLGYSLGSSGDAARWYHVIRKLGKHTTSRPTRSPRPSRSRACPSSTPPRLAAAPQVLSSHSRWSQQASASASRW